MQNMKIKIPEEVSNYLEGLTYECNSKRMNVEFMIRCNKNDESFLNSPAFKKYEKEQSLKEAEFEAAKRKMVTDYFPEELKDANANWYLDFDTQEVIVTLNNNSTCKCISCDAQEVF